MSALTVTLRVDISVLKRAMAGATELVGASTKRMANMSGSGLAGLGKGGKPDEVMEIQNNCGAKMVSFLI